MELVEGCPCLEEVSLRLNGGLADDLVSTLQSHCPHLTALTLSKTYITLPALLTLLVGPVAVRAVTFEDGGLSPDFRNTSLPDESLRSTLSELHLKQFSMSAEELRAILRFCPGLTKLTVADGAFDGSAFTNIGTLCPQLQWLDLCYIADAVDDSALLSLSEHCARLRLLGVTYSTQVTDAGVCAVARGCPMLESVYLPIQANITDASLLALAEHCPLLRTLRVDANDHITDNAVAAVLRDCPLLSDLSFFGCNELSKETMAQIRDQSLTTAR